MVFSNFNRADVCEGIKTYNEFPRSFGATEFVRYNGHLPKDYDDFVEGYPKTGAFLHHMSKKQVKQVLRNLVAWRNLCINGTIPSLDDYAILNKLIGDHKLHKKFQVVYDGSYLANRIWVCDSEYSGKDGSRFSVELLEYGHADIPEKYFHEFNKCNIAEKIDWIYNHFDTIFIQISDIPRIMLKEKNEKETHILKSVCIHHHYNKKAQTDAGY